MKSMKNNIKLKKCLTKVFFLSIILLTLFIILNILEYNYLKNNNNQKIMEILSVVKENYPLITDEELLKILNRKSNTQINLNKYGINILKDDITITNIYSYPYILIINTLYLIISISLILYLILKYIKYKNKELRDITDYLEEINNQNYSLKMDSLSEDELSILKNELYKVTICLKENALNNENDKLNLKTSLEDISHQLKTPLTSILIMLDNILENENMAKNQRKEFLKDIKREVLNINFLVQNLLKLAKFDVNTITFTKENIFLKDIIEKTIKKVAFLSDLKNINIVIKKDNEAKIIGDMNWEIEALTNVLKNCLEYSPMNSKIDIKYGENKVYSYIFITDYGQEIKKEDIKHIFERFYQGENKSNNNVGIGLELAKKIINKDAGTIDVISSKKETTFSIKYYK